MVSSFVLKTLKENLEFAVTFLDYAGVLAAIPKLWKSKILGISPMGGEPYKSLADSDIIPSSKKARLILAEQSFSPPIVEISLSKQVPNVKDVYTNFLLRSPWKTS